MKDIEKELLRQLGFSDAFKGDSVGNYPGNEVLTVVDTTYSLTFNGKSFIEVIRLMHAVSNDDIELNYAGYLIRIYLYENVLMGEVFDEQEYHNEHKDEPDMAQHTRLPLAAALNWIEQRLEDAAKLENIDDLPFPETVEVERGDIEQLIEAIDGNHGYNPEKCEEALKRINKVLES